MVCRAIAHRRPPEPEDELVRAINSDEVLVGRSADALITADEGIRALQQAAGLHPASRLLELGRRACVAATDEIDADRRVARRLGQLDDHDDCWSRCRCRRRRSHWRRRRFHTNTSALHCFVLANRSEGAASSLQKTALGKCMESHVQT